MAERRGDYESEYAAIRSVAAERHGHARDAAPVGPPGRGRLGAAAGVSCEKAAEIPAAAGEGERTSWGLRDSQGGIGYLRGRAGPALAALVRFTGEHKDVFGVKPICRVLTQHGVPIAPSAYYAAKSRSEHGTGQETA